MNPVEDKTLEDAAIVIADEDPEAAAGMVEALLAHEVPAVAVPDGAALVERIAGRTGDVAVVSGSLPGYEGTRLLGELRERCPGLPVILLSSAGDLGAVVEAVKAGAADVLRRPVDLEELVFAVKKALATVEATADEPPPSIAMRVEEGLIGNAPAFREALATLRRAAASDATVLVRGESGTGKELVARQVHELSARRLGPFVKVHCAALPDHLLESELFGYEKGAFTGAAARKPGRVELANGGTLFLDEIGDITPATQVKLLRVLQDKQYERLGGTQTLEANVRFVSATHRDLEAMVKAGSFREDLYYRLNVIPIVVPPLRRRQEDIEPLVRHFAAQASAANGRPIPTFDSAGLDLIKSHRWPGNVRQLQNFVERLVVLADSPHVSFGDVQSELLRLEAGLGRTTTSTRTGAAAPESAVLQLDEAVKRAEKRALEKALVRAGGNRSLAARILGVSRRTLYNKIQEFGLA